MLRSRNNLYTILFLACMFGYGWLYFGLTTHPTETNGVEVCLIKRITSIPCPSCGTTRSIISLAKGNLATSLYLNPFGLVVAVILLLTPFWVVIDLLTNRKTLFNFYHTAEYNLKKMSYAVPLVSLVIVNWIWNITKGL